MDVEIPLLIGSILLLITTVILVSIRVGLKMPGLLQLGNSAARKYNKERREHPRHKTSLMAKHKTPSEEGISWVSDISKSGARLLVNKPFEIGTVLTLEINLPYDSKPIFAQGDIVWAKENDAGLSFDEVEQGDIARIFQYIDGREQISRAR